MTYSINPKFDKISGAIYEYASSHHYSSMNGYTMISFSYIVRGTVRLTTAGTGFTLGAGDLFAISPQCRYHSEWRGEPDVLFYSLHLLPEPDVEIFTFPLQKIAALSVPETVERMLDIIRNLSAEGYADRMRAISLFCGFYADAIPHITDTAMHRLSPALVASMRYIDENYRTECSIDTLCKAACVSQSHMYYLFREELNTTPIHYRNRIRIEKCAEKLRTTDQEEIDIAESQGFRSLPYFRECFQRQIGITPFQYRSMEKKK